MNNDAKAFLFLSKKLFDQVNEYNGEKKLGNSGKNIRYIFA